MRGIAADARIVIAQDQRRMLAYERGKLIKTFPLSTGLPTARETSTPTWTGPLTDYWGTFSSFGTTQDDGYWLFTARPPDGRWNGDILIHAAPYGWVRAGKRCTIPAGSAWPRSATAASACCRRTWSGFAVGIHRA